MMAQSYHHESRCHDHDGGALPTIVSAQAAETLAIAIERGEDATQKSGHDEPPDNTTIRSVADNGVGFRDRPRRSVQIDQATSCDTSRRDVELT